MLDCLCSASFQAGVLWHLLLFLFNYDFTLDEGGVEKSSETNQQVWYWRSRTSLERMDIRKWQPSKGTRLEGRYQSDHPDGSVA